MEPQVRIDGHELYLGDCMAVFSGFPNHSIDLVLTDVPYKQEFHGRGMSAARPNYLKIKLCHAPKKYGRPWAGLVFHEDSVEAALYFENGSIYSTKPHPLDIMSEWDEE